MLQITNKIFPIRIIGIKFVDYHYVPNRPKIPAFFFGDL